MASRKVKPCCGRRKPAPKEFCSILRVTTGVALVSKGPAWSINVNHNGQQKDLATALAQHKCPENAAGTKLCRVLLHALQVAVAKGLAHELHKKQGRQMPAVLLKDFLFKAIGPCSSCRGRGCSGCKQMGVV